jgi:hypothetical protein
MREQGTKRILEIDALVKYFLLKFLANTPRTMKVAISRW